MQRDVPDVLGRRPAHWAAYARSKKALKQLNAGGDEETLNAQDKAGRSPLHVAVLREACYAAEFLLKCRARPDLPDRKVRELFR
jgi:ankyrin repeat protein